MRNYKELHVIVNTWQFQEIYNIQDVRRGIREDIREIIWEFKGYAVGRDTMVRCKDMVNWKSREVRKGADGRKEV